MTIQAGTTRTMVAVFLLAFAVRIGYLAVFRPGVEDWPDSRHNERIGWRLAQGEPYDHPEENPPASYRPPLLPFLIASIYRLVGRDPFVVQCSIAMLGAAGACALALAGRQMGRPQTGIWAGIAAALYPHHVFVCGTLYPEAIGVPLLELLVLLFVMNVCRDRMALTPMILLGAVLGLCALCRANWLVTLPLCLPLLYLCRRWRGRPSRMGLFPVAILAWLILWCPWAARNTLTHGGPMLITASGGKNFFLGNNPGSRWNSKTGVPILPEIVQRERELRTDPRALEAFFYEIAWGHVRSDPLRYLRLWLGKLAYLWQPFDSIKHHSIALYAVLLASGSYLAVLFWAVLGVVTAVRNREWIIPALLLLCLADSVLISLFITPHRLRIPFDSILLLAGAYGSVIRHRSLARSPGGGAWSVAPLAQ